MRKLLSIMLPIWLLAGLLSLGSLVQAGNLQQPGMLFYGLSITSNAVTLLQKSPSGDLKAYSKTTLTPELFGDPPNIAFNDSPLIFLTLFLSEQEVEDIKKYDAAYEGLQEDQVRRVLYISAAGYEAAAVQKLDSSTNGSGNTLRDVLRDTLANSHLAKLSKIPVVAELEKFGCFEEDNKAAFHLCGARWAMEYRTGIRIDGSAAFIEQDNQAASVMANELLRNHPGLQQGRHLIIQATTLAQPYLNQPEGLIHTPGWMGSGVNQINLKKAGGLWQIGDDFASQLSGDFQKHRSSSDSISTFMLNGNNTLYATIARYFDHQIKQGAQYRAGTTPLDTMLLLDRIVRGKAKNNSGELLMLIADSASHEDLTRITGQSRTDLAQSQALAIPFLSKARGDGAISIALFAGLLQPIFRSGASLIIVGEEAEWLAAFNKQPFQEVLQNLGSDPETLDHAYQLYLSLLDKPLFDQFAQQFSELNNRTAGDLRPGMSKDDFSEWLKNLPFSPANILYIHKAHYNDALHRAFTYRYDALKQQ